MIGSAPGCTVDGADQMFMLLAGKEGESSLTDKILFCGGCLRILLSIVYGRPKV